jgi:hypothetical protein
LPIIVTEFTSESPRWSRAPYDAGPEARSENNAASSADFGVSVAGEALKLIADGANQVSFWQAEDPSWSHDAFGLLDETGQRKPVASALQSFLQLLSNKDVRVAHPDRSPFGFAGAAFQTSRTLVVALANLTSTTRALQIEFDGAVRGKISAIRGFDANGPMNEKASHQAKYSHGVLSVDLGPRTVLTAVIQ